MKKACNSPDHWHYSGTAMDLINDWDRVRKHFNKSFRSNFHVSIASVDSVNTPTITPIGSLFLNDDRTGFYFEKFPSKLPQHAEQNRKVCLLAVYSGRAFWFKALFVGKFSHYPGVKLYGELGQKRKATPKEIKRLNRRMRYTRGLKGHDYLWKKMDLVREIRFTKAEMIKLGKMTSHL